MQIVSKRINNKNRKMSKINCGMQRNKIEQAPILYSYRNLYPNLSYSLSIHCFISFIIFLHLYSLYYIFFLLIEYNNIINHFLQINKYLASPNGKLNKDFKSITKIRIFICLIQGNFKYNFYYTIRNIYNLYLILFVYLILFAFIIIEKII